MIINNLENNKIKIIVDEKDLEKHNINISIFKSNPKKTSYYLKKLLNNKNLSFENFNISTYNFQVYCIEITLKA